MLLAAPQGLLRKFLFRNIANYGKHQRAGCRFDRAQHDVDGQFAPVLAAPVEFESRSHRAHAGLRGVAAAVLRVNDTESLRNQKLDGLTDEFLAVVIEHARGLRVRPNDGTGWIGDEHGIRGKRE